MKGREERRDGSEDKWRLTYGPHMLTQPVDHVIEPCQRKPPTNTAEGVNLQHFCELKDRLYPVLRLKDAIQPGA